MIKKSMVLFLCLILALSVCPVNGVFAASKTDEQISVNFDGLTSYEMCKQVDGSANTYSFPVVDGGKGGGQAMLFVGTAASNGATRYFRPGFRLSNITADSVVEASWDFRVSKFPTQVVAYDGEELTGDQTFMHFNGSPSGGTPHPVALVRKVVNEEVQVWLQYNSADIVQLTTADWITVKWIQIGTNAPYLELYNAAGNLIYSNNAGSYRDTAIPLICTFYAIGSDAELMIDNVCLNTYSGSTYGPSVVSCSMANGATNVPLSTNKITVTLDQPLKTPAATLTPNSGAAVSCTMALKSGYYRTYEITWDGALAGSKTYTLSLANAVNAQNTAVDATGVISFSTEDAPISELVVRDDFENEAFFTKDPPATYAHYGDGTLANTSATSNFFSHFSNGINGVTQTTGYTGNGAKVARHNYLTAALASRATFQPTADQSYVANFRMKIKDAPVVAPEEGQTKYSGGNMVSFGVDTSMDYSYVGRNIPNRAVILELDEHTGKHYFGERHSAYHGPSYAGKLGYYYSENTWYNVTWILTTTHQRFILADEAGNVCYDLTTEGTFTGSYHFVFAEVAGNDYGGAGKNDGTEITLDDMAIWTVNKTKATHKLAIQSVTGTEIDKDSDKILITYNQPVIVDPNTIDIYKGDDCTVLTEAKAKVTYPGFNTVALDVSAVDFASDYTLDLGGVISAGGAAMGDLTAIHSFSTKADDNFDVSIIGDFGGIDFASGTLTDVTLTADLHNNKADSVTADLFVAVYGVGDTLLGVEKQNNIALVSGMNRGVSVAFTKDYVGVTKVKLFVWKNGTLQPLGLAREKTIA